MGGGIIGIAGMEGAPGKVGGCICGPTPDGNPDGGAGIVAGLGKAGIPGRFVGPMPCGGGRFGMVGAPGVCECGPTPGGSPPGICGKPGGMGDEFSVTGFNRTKLRLLGKSKFSSPELRSRMSTGFGQFVAVFSTRRKFVPTV